MISQQLSQLISARSVTQSVHAPAADTAAVVTLAAVVGERHVIHAIRASYSATPTGGGLTVTSGATTILTLAIVGTSLILDGPLIGGVNEAVVVTLLTGAGTVVGKLNVTSIKVV